MDIAMQGQKDGVRNLRQSGLVKVKHGLTSVDEVLAARTTNCGYWCRV